MRFFTLFIIKKSPKLRGVQIRKFVQNAASINDPLCRSILSIFSKSSLCTFYDPIDGPTTLSIDSLTVRRCFLLFHTQPLITSTFCQDGLSISRRTVDPSVAPHLVRIPRISSRCLNHQSTVTTYGQSMGRRAVDGFVNHFCTNSLQPSAFWFWTTFLQNKYKTYSNYY